MPTTSFDKESIKQSIIGKLQRYNGRTVAEATPQIYKAVASTVRDQIMQKWMIAREERKRSHAKRLYYLSVEFLMGRSLYNNMLNLVSTDVYTEALKELGINLQDILVEEPEVWAVLPRAFWTVCPALTCPPWAAPSAMNTACSVRRSWTASRWSCPTTGWATATSGKCP